VSPGGIAIRAPTVGVDFADAVAGTFEQPIQPLVAGGADSGVRLIIIVADISRR